MKIGIPLETAEGERRVAATPDTVAKLKKLGFDVQVCVGAGKKANYSDDEYSAAGAELVDVLTVWSESDILLKVTPPSLEEARALKEGAIYMGLLWPAENEALVEVLKDGKVSAIAMDNVPRITRAQKLDVRSSMSNIDGYRAVIEAAHNFESFLSGQITAAGKVKPATVFVVGAGVAGLAAIGAARGLNAQVKAFDVRAAAREQVESMGAEFVEVSVQESGEGEGGYAKEMSDRFKEAQLALFKELASTVDIVITTALIPGRDAPKLWLNEAIAEMKAGSVVVDLAAERGGNCEATVKGELITTENGVKVIGYTDMSSRLSPVASQLYGMNCVNYIKDIKSGEGEVSLDLKDVVVRTSIVTHEGEILWPPPPLSELDPASVSKEMKPATEASAQTSSAPPEKPETPVETAVAPEATVSSLAEDEKPATTGLADLLPAEFGTKQAVITGVAVLWILLLLSAEPGAASESTQNFLNHLTVFALSCFIGWQVIWNVSHALHTPLMSVTNAISGIILVGGMLQAHGEQASAAGYFGALAVLLAMINVVGGFAVTQRMLAMFRK